LSTDTKYNEFRVRFSPDGHWILYTSNETGRNEIYVQTFPASDSKWQVSVQGAQYGNWRKDGKEILFDSLDGTMMAVDVSLGKTFAVGLPHKLFDIPGQIVAGRYAVTSDGQRFLLSLPAQTNDRASLVAVMNWTGDLKK
jgi:hypothetical protein